MHKLIIKELKKWEEIQRLVDNMKVGHWVATSEEIKINKD